MTFLVLLRKFRDKKECHKNISEKWRMHTYKNSLDFKLNLYVVARNDTFKKNLLQNKRAMTSTPPKFS